MTQGFVWFHNGSLDPKGSVEFHEKLLGWTRADRPPGMTRFAGPAGPFAAIGEEQGATDWISFAEVTDLDAATAKAKKLGAKVAQKKTRSPQANSRLSGTPATRPLALWQKA